MTDEEMAEMAEDYANKKEIERNNLECVIVVNYEISRAFKDGAEFGYNKCLEEAKQNYNVSDINWAIVNDYDKRIAELTKANEWHYVKDGDLPNTETEKYTYIRRRKRYERQFIDYRVIKCFVLCLNENGKITADVGYFDCNRKCFFDKAEGMVYAWKEIVLPKEIEK